MAEPFRHIAVIDIGKTNAKVALVGADDGHEIALRTTANRVRQDGPYPHFDVAALWAFICDALAEMQRESPIDAISITAHGASGVLITGDPQGDGLALPVLDYEFSGPDEFAAEYDAVRPPFSESLSARLPGGLNLGAQVFWQAKRLSGGVRRRALRHLPAILGLAALRRGGDGGDLARLPHRSLEPRREGFFEPRGPARLAREDGAAALRLRPARPGHAGARAAARARSRHAGLLRHPRFQRLAAPASRRARPALHGRLDGNLDHRARRRRQHRKARPAPRRARLRQRLRRRRCPAPASWAGANSTGSPAESPSSRMPPTSTA